MQSIKCQFYREIFNLLHKFIIASKLIHSVLFSPFTDTLERQQHVPSFATWLLNRLNWIFVGKRVSCNLCAFVRVFNAFSGKLGRKKSFMLQSESSRSLTSGESSNGFLLRTSFCL